MQRVDGRDARWEAHRVRRRRALVESALRAIRRHGPGVTLDDVAAMAGTSKTVLYRYFGDRDGLYLGVVARVSENILADVLPRLESTPKQVGTIVHELVDAYTAMVERDPEIYRFVMNRPAGAVDGAAAVASIEARVAAALSASLTIEGSGRNQRSLTDTLAYGLVGFVKAASDHWMASAVDGRLRPRLELVNEVASLFGAGTGPSRTDVSFSTLNLVVGGAVGRDTALDHELALLAGSHARTADLPGPAPTPVKETS